MSKKSDDPSSEPETPKVPRLYKFTECRLNHRWLRTRAPQRTPSWGYLISYECEGCGAIRNDTINDQGELSTRQYLYPDGYKLEAGLVRARFRQHLIGQFSQREMRADKDS